MDKSAEASRYLDACRSPFWRRVFAAEMDYLLQHLRAGEEILSVGCGPAIIERGLIEHGCSVVGLDVSQEAIACASDSIRTIVASAEKMPLADERCDVVLFIASLQFIANYRLALAETWRVLRPGGRVIALLLNPAGEFFVRKQSEAGSYVQKIRHTDLVEMEAAMAERFAVQGEYILGISAERVFASSDPETAALYVLKGRKPAAP